MNKPAEYTTGEGRYGFDSYNAEGIVKAKIEAALDAAKLSKEVRKNVDYSVTVVEVLKSGYHYFTRVQVGQKHYGRNAQARKVISSKKDQAIDLSVVVAALIEEAKVEARRDDEQVKAKKALTDLQAECGSTDGISISHSYTNSETFSVTFDRKYLTASQVKQLVAALKNL